MEELELASIREVRQGVLMAADLAVEVFPVVGLHVVVGLNHQLGFEPAF